MGEAAGRLAGEAKEKLKKEKRKRKREAEDQSKKRNGFLRGMDCPEHPAKEDSFAVSAVSLTLEVDLRRLKPNKALREKGILGYECNRFIVRFGS